MFSMTPENVRPTLALHADSCATGVVETGSVVGSTFEHRQLHCPFSTTAIGYAFTLHRHKSIVQLAGSTVAVVAVLVVVSIVVVVVVVVVAVVPVVEVLVVGNIVGKTVGVLVGKTVGVLVGETEGTNVG